MSAIASRPASTANSFYESEGRPSFDHARLFNPTNKTRELARAIGRERDGVAPSFRPPSSWTQNSSHHDVVWTGEVGQAEDGNDDQFSDTESWDADTQATSHGPTSSDYDATTSVYGHVRPTSVASHIFAGRGAKTERRRREVPPPLPTLPASQNLQQGGQYLGAETAGLLSPLSPSAQSMLSPMSDASGFETSSQYSVYDSKDHPAYRDSLAAGLDMQDASSGSKNDEHDAAEDHILNGGAQPVPSRNSSRMAPPIPTKAASRSSSGSLHRENSTSEADHSLDSSSKHSPARLADGTLIPKMPPVPQSNDLSRPRKTKNRRERSPILSYDGGAAEEEKMLVALQDKLAKDALRISTLGPKVKKNAPAPWELGGDDGLASPGRPSLKDSLRPSADTFEKSFSRFKSRPSVESASIGVRSPNPAHAPSGLAHNSNASNVPSLEQEAQKEDDAQSLFATQRSRSKSVSNTAAGMLKGLGLASAAAPASSKKGKLTKALRLVGAGGAGNDGRRPSHPPPAPLSELPGAVNINHVQSGVPQSHSIRNINGGSMAPPQSKSGADLIDAIMASNGKYRDQARSPPLPSPKLANGMPSPLVGGGMRSLSYKKDTLSAANSAGLSDEQGQRSSSLVPSRSRTPPTREMSVTSRSDSNTEAATLARISSAASEDAMGPTPAEGESTPVGKGASTSVHHAGAMSVSSSQTSGSLPLPGNIEGVPYKLISLEEAREQARQKQSEWLAASGEAAHDEFGMQRDPSSDGGQGSMRMLMNKKSGYLLRKLKNVKAASEDGGLPNSGSIRDLARFNKSPMPSFSITGLDEENDQLKPLGGGNFAEKPALQIRPVSSMFSGFAADFLDASALSEGHGREASSGSLASSSGLLVPQSPLTSSFRSPSPEAAKYRPKLADIRPTPHGAPLPGPIVPGSADSTWSARGASASATDPQDSRLPSLDADTQSSQFHSPVHSPLTPSFHHSVHPPTSNNSLSSPDPDVLSPPGSPTVTEEVRQRAREIEAQIQELSNELHELRVKHVGQGTAPSFKQKEGEGRVVGDCPACGCGCAEQRRLQSINEAAVLKGISVLDRGRALKPSSNMGNTGKFGGYTNR